MGTTIQKNVKLAPKTTIRLGGIARFFIECKTIDDIKEALNFAKKNNLRTHVLAGGSNTIFPDSGFDGLVIKINLTGITTRETTITALAGEPWDNIVIESIKHGLAGLECMSGIPGSVGATPIQNVGAYGQDVAETITTVRAIERASQEIAIFDNAACNFRYRSSRFKEEDHDKFIVTSVSFKLRRNGQSTLKYPELLHLIGGAKALEEMNVGTDQLTAVRNAVLTLRKRKSMVIDNKDLNTRSCGSFFINPIVSGSQLKAIKHKLLTAGLSNQVPVFPEGKGVKVPAAWLIEQSGFTKGERRGGVGISANHMLALINRGGTTKELLDFAAEIEAKVQQNFGIKLAREPIVVKN